LFLRRAFCAERADAMLNCFKSGSHSVQAVGGYN
jgi:hypothetical protein